jgi:hypothetical protein
VAEDDGIATEPPVDIEECTMRFARSADESFVAVAHGRIVGMLHVDVSRSGFGEFGMLVDRPGAAAGSVRRSCRRRSTGRAANWHQIGGSARVFLMDSLVTQGDVIERSSPGRSSATSLLEVAGPAAVGGCSMPNQTRCMRHERAAMRPGDHE